MVTFAAIARASARSGRLQARQRLSSRLRMPFVPHSPNRRAWLITLATLLASAAWLLLVFLFDSVRFVVLDPQAKTGFEMFLAVGQMFGAFILALSPAEPLLPRMRWVAGGFAVLSLGTIGYGYAYPLLVDAPDLTVTMYGSLLVRTSAVVLIAFGVTPRHVPSVSRAVAVAMSIGVVSMALLLGTAADTLPSLVSIHGVGDVIDQQVSVDEIVAQTRMQATDIDAIASATHAKFPGLTAWHWLLATIPLAISAIAVIATTRRYALQPIGLWLLAAISLLASAQLHSLFWPSMYSSILTTTSVLRLAVTLAVITGGILEFRRVIRERATLLAEEQERVRRLEELTRLKADFTSMVAHELATPLAAISTMSEMVTLDDLPDYLRRDTARGITAETRALQTLVKDISDAAEVERDDFRVSVRPTPIALLISQAETYARTLPGNHPIDVDGLRDVEVMADPERISQVMRNLLINAARHTPDGTRISIRARLMASSVVVEVADDGPGINSEDQQRIFQKFGRGLAPATKRIAGKGLGLYLSRRILQGHGSDLVLSSTPRVGTTFSFALEKAP